MCVTSGCSVSRSIVPAAGNNSKRLDHGALRPVHSSVLVYHRLLSGFDLNTTHGQRDAVRLRSSSGAPARAFKFLTAIPGGCMTLSIGTDMLISSVCHHLWYHVPADVAAPPFKCVAAVAVRADHALVCEKVATIAQMA